MIQKILVIDDDPINNMLCAYTIKKSFRNSEVCCFEIPHDGLDHVISQYNAGYTPPPTIVFLDINMPEMDCWGFLDELKKMKSDIKNQFKIYILSSSINPADIEKAHANIFVEDFLSKPLNELILQKVINANN